MPKKTREEKILARLRRLEQINQVETQSNSPENTEPKGSGYNLKEVSPTPKVSPPPLRVSEETNYSYIKRDLAKTLLLTVGAILIEVVLTLTVGKKI